ncbi:recombinase family protein [Plantibacter sp. YIM 135249]|uniref:recombinase family protein n=1 Tax=Plantibacter sp. YIM 135249 TaxID=3423918 RepID=UPI003D354A89
MRAGIYARISKDTEGTGLGVKRQEQDCRREAERRGWDVVSVYTDNDVSATRSKKRPAYDRMVTDIKAGHINAIIVWDVDRLTRTPRELEDVIDMANTHGLALANVGGDIDISTPDGRMMARIKGTVARREVESMSRRLKRKFQEKAEKGEPHGYSPYGFKRILDADGDSVATVRRDVVDEEQAAVVREAARRVLAHESLRSIVNDFNARGIHGPQAPMWNSTILRQILTRPTNAGLRQYQGQVIGKSTTEPIYSSETHDQLVALLTDPSRRSNHVGPGFKYLLSGLAICGLCGGPMRRQIGRTVVSKQTGSSKRQDPSYNCSECFKVRRKQAPVDELVTEVLVARLSRPDALDLFAQTDTAAADEHRSQLSALDAKLDIVADQFAADEITATQLKRITSRLRDERVQLERLLRAAQPRTVVADLAGGDVRAKWEAMPIAAQREVVESLLTVTIQPSGSGRRFDPEDVSIVWRT